MPRLPPFIARAHRLVQDLPGVEIAEYFGQPALKVKGKTLANLCREPDALAVYCPIDLKEMLCEAAPEIYFDTPHFRNWPAILVRMNAIDDATLAHRLAEAHAQRTARRRTAKGP
jgi:hypothetical protein